MSNPFYALRLDDLRLWVRLGCSEDERSKPQEVRFSLEFRFARAPGGTLSDRLEETICYADVCAALEKYCRNREFKLIERLGHEGLVVAREFAGRGVQVALKIHKVRPPVENLLGGATFICGDFAP